MLILKIPLVYLGLVVWYAIRAEPEPGVDPNDYSVFTCTNCHTKAQTDPKHQGVGGYVYNSNNCYQCHKGG